MNQNALKQKLEAVASFPQINADTVAQFGKVVEGLKDAELFRINPLRFAAEHNFDTAETVSIFVHGARVGLFDFAWNMLCPSCGSIVDSYVSMNDVESNVFPCTLCHCVVASNLDDCIEVAFTLNGSVHQLDIHPFKDEESYWQYFRSANHQRSPALEDYVAEVSRAFLLLAPEENQDVSVTAEMETVYRVISIDNHVSAFVTVTDKQSKASQRIEFSVLPNILTPKEAEIDAGDVTIDIRNLCKTPTGVVVVLTDLARLHTIIREHPSTFRPFLTGKMLLNNQSFRELFRIQSLIPDLKLRLRSLTLLFTDLKGSTTLYDQTGDVFAYSLVQEHYKILTESVRQNSGAVIKTMGDAIMATFSTPIDGVRAALEMLQRMKDFNSGLSKQEHALGLKIGLHEGSALAVNAEDRLDYFGHAVNVASRVQGLAEVGEICVTEPVLQADGVRTEFARRGYMEEARLVSLKGIGRPVNVYQLRKDHSQLKTAG